MGSGQGRGHLLRAEIQSRLQRHVSGAQVRSLVKKFDTVQRLGTGVQGRGSGQGLEAGVEDMGSGTKVLKVGAQGRELAQDKGSELGHMALTQTQVQGSGHERSSGQGLGIEAQDPGDGFWVRIEA